MLLIYFIFIPILVLFFFVCASEWVCYSIWHCYCGGAFKNVIREYQVSRRFLKSKIARNTKCAKMEHHPITKHNVQQLKHKPYRFQLPSQICFLSFFSLSFFASCARCVGVRSRYALSDLNCYQVSDAHLWQNKNDQKRERVNQEARKYEWTWKWWRWKIDVKLFEEESRKCLKISEQS